MVGWGRVCSDGAPSQAACPPGSMLSVAPPWDRPKDLGCMLAGVQETAALRDGLWDRQSLPEAPGFPWPDLHHHALLWRDAPTLCRGRALRAEKLWRQTRTWGLRGRAQTGAPGGPDGAMFRTDMYPGRTCLVPGPLAKPLLQTSRATKP